MGFKLTTLTPSSRFLNIFLHLLTSCQFIKLPINLPSRFRIKHRLSLRYTAPRFTHTEQIYRELNIFRSLLRQPQLLQGLDRNRKYPVKWQLNFKRPSESFQTAF